MAQEKVTVSIVRGRSVGESVARAVGLVGGLGFIRPGQTVLVKPNVNSPDPYPGTTNPEVVYEVVRLVWEQDPRRVIVADRSWFRGRTLDLMRTVGIYEAAREAKAEVIPFDDGPWQEVHPRGADHWPKGFHIPALLGQVDHVISLPVVKTHRLATFTMSLKNAVGLIPPEDRMEFLHQVAPGPDGSPGFRPESHQEPAFGSRIAELNLAYNVSLVVMDGTRAFVSGGPDRGEMVEPKVIIASQDRVANDVVGLALLKTLGTEARIQKPSVWEQPQIKRAVALGLGVKGPEAIDLKAEGVAEVEEIRKNLE